MLRLRASAGLIAILLILTGCSGGDSNEASGPSAADSSDAPQLAQTYPVQLTLPGSELISSDEALDQGGVRATAVWRIEAEVEDLLDFFARALAILETPGETERLELGSAGVLRYQGADNGLTYASVEVESGDDGLRTVTVSYLVGVKPAPSPESASNDDEPTTAVAESDAEDDDAEAPEVVRPNLPRTRAMELLPRRQALPARRWGVSDSTLIEVDFSTPFFEPRSCQAVTQALAEMTTGSTTAADLASRTFSYDDDLTLVRLAFAVATFRSVAESNAFFVALDGIVDDELRICFVDAIAEARTQAAAQGVELETRLGEPSFIVARSSALEAHAESTIALVDLTANLQLHVLQRGLAVGVFASVVVNDDDSLEAIPGILADVDRRLGGDGGGTNDGGGGNADSGNSAVSGAIPAALIHPDGPGGWTSMPTSEGTLFKAGFSLDPNSNIEEVLDFYVDAFASLGAPSVTSRLVTPISGEVEASGPGGRGSVQIFAAPGIIGLQANFLQFE